MSDRINTITVVLERDIRDDDCEGILTFAIRMVKGVLRAEPNIAQPQDYMAEVVRVKHELGTKLWEVLYPKCPK